MVEPIAHNQIRVDQRILALYKAGDKEWKTLLYGVVASRAIGFAQKSVDKHTAEDIVHDAWISFEAYAPNRQFNEYVHIEKYFWKTLHNKLNDWFRHKNGRGKKQKDQIFPQTDVSKPAEDDERQNGLSKLDIDTADPLSANPLKILIREDERTEALEVVREVLETIEKWSTDKKYARIFLEFLREKHRDENISYAEVAASHSVAANNVKGYAKKVRDRLCEDGTLSSHTRQYLAERNI